MPSLNREPSPAGHRQSESPRQDQWSSGIAREPEGHHEREGTLPVQPPIGTVTSKRLATKKNRDDRMRRPGTIPNRVPTADLRGSAKPSDDVASIPGMIPISGDGRPNKRMRSGSLGSGTPPDRASRVGRHFSQINPRGREIFVEARSSHRLIRGRLVAARIKSRSCSTRPLSSLVSARNSPSNDSLRAAQGHLVIDEQRHELLVIAPGAAIELGNKIADRAGQASRREPSPSEPFRQARAPRYFPASRSIPEVSRPKPASSPGPTPARGERTGHVEPVEEGPVLQSNPIRD